MESLYSILKQNLLEPLSRANERREREEKEDACLLLTSWVCGAIK